MKVLNEIIVTIGLLMILCQIFYLLWEIARLAGNAADMLEGKKPLNINYFHRDEPR